MSFIEESIKIHVMESCNDCKKIPLREFEMESFRNVRKVAQESGIFLEKKGLIEVGGQFFRFVSLL